MPRRTPPLTPDDYKRAAEHLDAIEGHTSALFDVLAGKRGGSPAINQTLTGQRIDKALFRMREDLFVAMHKCYPEIPDFFFNRNYVRQQEEAKAFVDEKLKAHDAAAILNHQ
jgi:hypothetical protein